MKKIFALLFLGISYAPFAVGAERPRAYTDLLDYIIIAPNQGDTGTCLYMSSTGSMEILLNQKYGLKDQRPGDRFDLAEQFIIFQKAWKTSEHRTVDAALKFNWGEAVHASYMPFEATLPDGSVNRGVWNKPPGFSHFPRMKVPQIKTKRLFVRGDKYSTYVLKPGDVEMVKQALWTYKSPVLINYRDGNTWHSVNIVGYDDSLPGNCWDTPIEECSKTNEGSFYVRDHYGMTSHVRDTDWFRAKGNAASVIMLK